MNVGTVCALIAALAPAADPEVIEAAVQDWLDDHPEATTTVEDGSITEAKLATALAAKINGMDSDVSSLKSAIKPIREMVVYDHDGQYIALNNATANVTSFQTLSSYECAVVACSEGDAFVVTAGGQNATRAWGFVASDGTVLSVESANVRVQGKVVYAPAGSAYFVTNNHKSGDYSGTPYTYRTDPYAVSSDRVVSIPEALWENGTYAFGNTEDTYTISTSSNRLVCRCPVKKDADTELTINIAKGYKYRVLYSTNGNVLARGESHKLYTPNGWSDYDTWYDFNRTLVIPNTIIGIVVTVARTDNANMSASEGENALAIMMGKGLRLKREFITSLEYELEPGAINSSGADVDNKETGDRYYLASSCRTKNAISLENVNHLVLTLKRATGATIPAGNLNFYTYLYFYHESNGSLVFLERAGGAGKTSVSVNTIPVTATHARISFTYTKIKDVEDSELQAYTMLDVSSICNRVNRLEGLSITVPQKGIVLGDSISFGLWSYWDGDRRKNADDIYDYISDTASPIRISDWLARYYGIPFDNIAKRGTGWVADTRSLGNALAQANATDFSNYDIVALCFGVNDYIQKCTMGTISDNTEGTIIGNMIHTLSKIYTDNPLAKVVVFSPLNAWGQCRSSVENPVYYGDASTHYALGYDFGGTSFTLQALIDAMQSVCDAYDVRHVAMSQGCTINMFNIKDILIDGLHPSQESMKSIASDMYHEMMFR